MPPMSPSAVYGLAVGAGLDHEGAIIATAVSWAESGLNPDAEGDDDLTDETWGRSVGLWQVRSLRAQSGTGGPRDAVALLDPAHNARAMAVISAIGEDFTPWTDYRSGKYRAHLDAVRAAVEVQPMELWHPRAIRVGPGTDYGNSYIGVPWKVVLHTTESDNYWPDGDSYFGSTSWPHATIVAGMIYQHIPIDLPARALYHGGPEETNRANAIQCEIVTRAALTPVMSDALMETVADWFEWVLVQTNTPMTFAEFHGPGEGIVLASEDSPIRIRGDDWYDFTGILGHQHVPSGNDHWDPGRFPVDRLRAAIVGTPTPLPEGEPMLVQLVCDGEDWLYDSAGRIMYRITAPIWDVLTACSVPRVVVERSVLTEFQNVARNAGFSG